MKVLFLLIVSFMFIPAVYAQMNHVPNGSFENNTGHPDNQDQVTQKCVGWRAFHSSPDYFSVLATAHQAWLVGVPFNILGNQWPAEGKAYCGLAAYSHMGTPSGNFEYISAPITPLEKGVTYEVSLSVSLAEFSMNATNNLGVFFYDDGPLSVPGMGILPIIPQVHYSNYGVIKDSNNWVRLTGYFVADSAYDNIVIGGFNDSSGSYDLDTLVLDTFISHAYYYIDSVVIKPYFPTDIGKIKSGSNLKIYPNPNHGSFVLCGNVDTDDLHEITIVNATGQTVYSVTCMPVQGVLNAEIELHDLPGGIYFLKTADRTGKLNTVRFEIE